MKIPSAPQTDGKVVRLTIGVLLHTPHYRAKRLTMQKYNFCIKS